MPRGGRRPGAGRPRKPVEQHLAEGTYRASRHRRWLASPALARPSGRRIKAEARWQELLGEKHYRLTPRQLRLARSGPAAVLRAGSEERLYELMLAWNGWDRAFGLRWRLQNECPRASDAAELAQERAVEALSAAELVAIVDEHVSSFDPSVPNPPPWEQEPDRPRGERWREDAALRVACGSCTARVIVLPATIAAAIPTRSLARVRAVLAALVDQGSRYALADTQRHFRCPTCGADQYLATDDG